MIRGKATFTFIVNRLDTLLAWQWFPQRFAERFLQTVCAVIYAFILNSSGIENCIAECREVLGCYVDDVSLCRGGEGCICFLISSSFLINADLQSCAQSQSFDLTFKFNVLNFVKFRFIVTMPNTEMSKIRNVKNPKWNNFKKRKIRDGKSDNTLKLLKNHHIFLRSWQNIFLSAFLWHFVAFDTSNF